MGNPAARVGDANSHGGAILTGDPKSLLAGSPAARKGDVASCPVHGPAKIAKTSATVIIGGAPAARMGDACACASAGKAGSGAPAVLGPGLAPIVTVLVGDPNISEDDLLKRDGTRGSRWERTQTDRDQDGTLDGEKIEGSLAKGRKDFEVGDGKGRYEVEFGKGEAHASGNLTDRGAAFDSGASGAVVSHELTLTDAAGNSVKGTATGLNGDVHARGFIGDDGTRVGAGFDVEAAGNVVTGGVETVQKTTVQGLVDRLAMTNPLFAPTALVTRGIGMVSDRAKALLDTPAQLTAGVSGDLLAAGGGAGGHAYYDKQTEQLVGGARFSLKVLGGAELVLGVVLGEDKSKSKAKPPPPPPPAAAPAPVDMGPNLITGGAPTILIGG